MQRKQRNNKKFQFISTFATLVNKLDFDFIPRAFFEDLNNFI